MAETRKQIQERGVQRSGEKMKELCVRQGIQSAMFVYLYKPLYIYIFFFTLTITPAKTAYSSKHRNVKSKK